MNNTKENKMSNVSFQQPGKVKMVNGSILMPHNAGLRFILSINNMKGSVEGNPLFSVFDKKWLQVKVDSKGFYTNKTGSYKLGTILGTTATQSDTWVIHCLVQDENLQVNLPSLEKCLKDMCKMAKYEKASIHISSILTQMIPELSELVNEHLVKNGVGVSYY